MTTSTSTSNSNKFPVKLYNILQEAEKTPYLAEIVSWLPDGKSFKVHQKDEFSKSILPATFGTNVYKSFQRNLHFWGFHNIRKGPSKGVCSHPYFVRGRPEHLTKMRRVRAPSKSNEHDSDSFEQQPREESGSLDSERRNVPNYVLAGEGSPRRVVSPSSMASVPASRFASLAENPRLAADPNTNGTAALLMLLQQQQQHQYQQQSQNSEQQQKLHQSALAETLIVQHLLAQQQQLQQQQQQQQQKRLQELLAAQLAGKQETQSGAMDQGALTRALVSQLLQQQGSSNGPSTGSLLSSLLR